MRDNFATNMRAEVNGCADFENRKNHEPKAVGEILPDTTFFAEAEDCEETTVTAAAEPGNVASKEGTTSTAISAAAPTEPLNDCDAPLPDDIPGTPNYNWKKYGYTLITEETMSGGPHPGDYEKDGVLHCGYCHKPKYILHDLFGKVQAFPIDCDCMKECLARISNERKQREHLIQAENCRRHALPFEHMHTWDFAHDDGGSPAMTRHAKHYVENFPEMREKGLGLFLVGITGTGKTYVAAEIINALCDRGYHCLLTSFADIVLELLSMNRERRLAYIDEICRHDLIVFDGYGAEPSTYFSDMNIMEIVEICYNRQVPIIVTTCLTQKQLLEGNVTRMNIMARIRERCYFLTLGNLKRRNRLADERWSRFRKLLDIRNNGGNGPVGGTGGAPAMPSLYEDPVLIGEAEDETA